MTTLTDNFQRPRINRGVENSRTRLNISNHVIGLAILITSFFYTVPFGRYQIGGVLTDFRVYDFVFLLFLLVFGLKKLSKLKMLRKGKFNLLTPTLLFMVIVAISLISTAFLGGLQTFLSALLRTYRFYAYLLTGLFFASLPSNIKEYKLLLFTFFTNIIIQASIAFLQGLKILPPLWPSYWIDNYGFLPTGTLSPHHLQIGIMMILGVCFSLAFFDCSKSLFQRFFLILLLGLMSSVTVLAEVRTGMFGIILVIVLYFLFGKKMNFFQFVLIGAVVVFLLVNIPATENIQTQVMIDLNVSVFDRYENEGIMGIVGDRVNTVYSNIPETLKNYPFIIFFGKGFQNTSFALGGGLHNNYLQVLFELGIIGLIVFLSMLWAFLKSLRKTILQPSEKLIKTVARNTLIFLITVMVTMFANETLWPQYSTFTLTGQILAVLGLAVSPRYWPKNM